MVATEYQRYLCKDCDRMFNIKTGRPPRTQGPVSTGSQRRSAHLTIRASAGLVSKARWKRLDVRYYQHSAAV